VVIATDYDNYWIQYECRETNGFRVESAIMRSRTRGISTRDNKIYNSLVEGIGFNIENTRPVSQTSCERRKDGRPSWYLYQ
jgi:hypothetical protein